METPGNIPDPRIVILSVSQLFLSRVRWVCLMNRVVHS